MTYGNHYGIGDLKKRRGSYIIDKYRARSSHLRYSQIIIVRLFMPHRLTNITIEFMFAGINMFWARLDSF